VYTRRRRDLAYSCTTFVLLRFMGRAAPCVSGITDEPELSYTNSVCFIVQQRVIVLHYKIKTKTTHVKNHQCHRSSPGWNKWKAIALRFLLFLGAFPTLWSPWSNCCLSVCTHVILRERLNRFLWNFIWRIFNKLYRQIPIFIKIWQ
jgi:hypothetical protein